MSEESSWKTRWLVRRAKLVDCIWPTIQGGNEIENDQIAYADRVLEEVRKRVQAIRNDDHLKDYLDLQQRLIADEDTRRHKVEIRLGGTLGLAAVLSSLALGVSGGVLVKPWMQLPPALKLIMGLLLAYIFIQLFHISWHSLKGLERRTYLVVGPSDALPQTGKPHDSFLRGHIVELAEVLCYNKRETSRKVDAMALAHRSAINYLVGLLLLFIVSLIAQLSVAPPIDDERLLKALRDDPKLIEMLRGPEGPPGPPGPKGAKGDPGLPGKLPPSVESSEDSPSPR